MVPCGRNIHKFDEVPVICGCFEVYAMWVALQIGVCLVFLMLAAFWVGRKIGLRRFFKLEEEMKALELSFKHLVDDIEMVTSHNIKALDGQCGVLKELLVVADKKCLYANDLLKELDTGVESLRKRNLNPANALASIDQGLDKRFRKEVHDTLEEMLKKIVNMNDRIGELEANENSFDEEELRALVGNEIARYLEALDLTPTVQKSPSPPQAGRHSDRVAELKMCDATVEKLVSSTPLRSLPREAPVQMPVAAVAVQPPVSAKTPVSIKELRASAIDDTLRLPAAVKMTDLGKSSSASAAPMHNYAVGEVLRLYSEGMTLPQIARNLNMGKGEIELIIKIHGEGINMRNVV